jgi:hypothetical protein
MYGASLEWLAPDICVVRAGLGHEKFGDPWSFVVTVKVIDGKAEFHGGRGSDAASNFRSQMAVVRALRSIGLRVNSDWLRIKLDGPI